MVYDIKCREKIRLMGRYDPTNEIFCAHWTGSGIEVKIRCRRLEIEIEKPPEHGTEWLLVTLDGAPVSRFPIENGRRWYTAFDGSDTGFEHTVTIVRDSQPYGEELIKPLMMHAIRTDGELLPLEEKPLTIEFIGDSITTGEGIAGPKGTWDWTTLFPSSYNYTQMVCDELKAQRRVVSQSGWGVYSAWNGNRNEAIPRIFNQLCGAGDGTTPYDFSLRPADAVVINLGTNDGSALDQCKTPEERRQTLKSIGRAAENFIRQIRQCYPEAYILWAYGMCGATISRTLKAAVERVRQSGDERVGFALLPACTDQEYGSRFHPGVPNHRRAARIIAEKLKAELNNGG